MSIYPEKKKAGKGGPVVKKIDNSHRTGFRHSLLGVVWMEAIHRRKE